VLSAKIEELGGEPFEFPSIEIVEPDDYSLLDHAIEEIATYDWLIFTSTNGVQAFFRRLQQKKKDVRALHGLHICAIGPKTEEEIEKYGLFCDLVPDEFVAEALLEEFKHYELQDKKILLPRADIARKVLPDTLRQMGAKVTDVVAYKTVMGNGDKNLLKKMLERKQIQIATFTSSSTVRNFITMLEEENYQELLEDVQIACIGPITAQTARQLGLKVAVEAKVYTIEGLLNAILEVG
jgi:uroporphyrinogen III methyltransferase/synthase